MLFRSQLEQFKQTYPQKVENAETYENKNVYVTTAIEIDYMTPPMDERKKVLKDVHNFGHFGSESMVKEIHSKGYHWPKLVDEAKDVVKKCPPCQK